MAKCPTCGREPKRSSEANRRYWALLGELTDKLHPQGKVYSRTTWHEYFKERYLGADEVTLPNGKTRIISKSTADLDKGEFHEYATQVEVWCGEHNVWLDE